MVKTVSRLWMRVQGLGVPLTLLVAVAAAAILWLIAIALGPWAVLFVAPSGLAFLTFFGAAFVSVIGTRSIFATTRGTKVFASYPIRFTAGDWIGHHRNSHCMSPKQQSVSHAGQFCALEHGPPTI